MHEDGNQENRAEERAGEDHVHDHCAGEAAVSEDRQVQERVRATQLPPREGRDQRDAEAQRDQSFGRPPAVVGGLGQAVDDQGDPGHRQDQPNPIERARRAARQVTQEPVADDQGQGKAEDAKDDTSPRPVSPLARRGRTHRVSSVDGDRCNLHMLIQA